MTWTLCIHPNKCIKPNELSVLRDGGCDGDVAKDRMGTRRAFTCASRHAVQPAHHVPRPAPYLECKNEASPQRLAHPTQIRTVRGRVECKDAASLLETVLDRRERRWIALRNKGLHMSECLPRVDEAVSARAQRLGIDHPAVTRRASPVALGDVPSRRCDALMRCHLHRETVRFDRVVFPTPHTAHKVRIAVCAYGEE